MTQYVYLETKANRSNDTFVRSQDLNSSTVLPGSACLSSSGSALPTTSTMTSTSNNIQYAVFCSSKQARVRNNDNRKENNRHENYLGHLTSVTSLSLQAKD
jgi:hypothetical protein